MDNELLWQAKLYARLHDPAEKALILMRTEHGHEGGSSRALLRRLIPSGVPAAAKAAAKRADHWASAADRAAFPNHEDDRRYPAWQQVHFHKKPILIHPLTGQSFSLQSLSEIDPASLETLSQRHSERLLAPDNLPQNLRASALGLWRFGPELEDKELAKLWALLPADTRVPDHTIWDHLDLTSALAGAFAVDQDGPALLTVSLGPVQDFIASARSTSDLWAGSHLLSRLSWEAMRILCEELGPDAILLPRLRGIPQVDLWLRDMGVDASLFNACAWARNSTDSNPLFAAALPNRFIALVPANRAGELAEKLTRHVRQWVLESGEAAVKQLLEAAGEADHPDLHCHAQLREQLAGFPEVHWAAVPWSLVGTDAKGKVVQGTPALLDAMKPFFAADKPGFLGSEAWALLSGGLPLDQGEFWTPNPGALYPALFELLERLLAATKSLRTFAPPPAQTGYRCSLTGEHEWLTLNPDHLKLPPGQRETAGTLWSLVKRERPSWVKGSEHLGALATLKRLWPTLYLKELKVKKLTGTLADAPQRFVVSTHTMALATSLHNWLSSPDSTPVSDSLRKEVQSAEVVALPAKMAAQAIRGADFDTLRRLPSWLERARDSDDEQERTRAERDLKDLLGTTPEIYYALILMDGDKMGAWLSADPKVVKKSNHDALHEQIQANLRTRFDGDANLQKYLNEPRAATPAWHMVISDALNNFALTLAPAIIERQFNGRILYAGGDDVMAMLPVSDLLPAMAALRAAYSGCSTQQFGGDESEFKRADNGFVQHDKQLLRLMGDDATASIGAVVAHYQAPLAAVLEELRAAEKRAKNQGGRDAFSLTVIKRSGGDLRLTCKWQRNEGDPAMRCLRELSQALAAEDASRRAAEDASRRAAYQIQQWLPDLPSPVQFTALDGAKSYRDMLQSLLAYQLRRQRVRTDECKPEDHARRLVTLALQEVPPPDSKSPDDQRKAHSMRMDFLNNFLSVAEFFARGARQGART